MHRARRRSGLTLIEIMVALGMLAILASLAVPELGRVMAYRKMQATAEQLAAEMNEARYDAARQGHTLHLQLQAGQPWCWSLSEAPGCACDQPRSCQQKRVPAPSRSPVRIENDLQLSFLPAADARPAARDVNLFTPYDERLRVTMTPMGRARICSPEGPRSGYPRC
jgi:type IV fimbrial biogenesis protein FimT